MSVLFGHDFSRVRIHADDPAATRAGARAFTAGQHIVLGPSFHRPDSPVGRRLLVHELSHVVQQQPGAATDTTAAAEHEAHRAAEQAPARPDRSRLSIRARTSAPVLHQALGSAEGPRPGDGAWMAAQHVALRRSVEQTHWSSNAERDRFITDYLNYSRTRGDLQAEYTAAAAAYPQYVSAPTIPITPAAPSTAGAALGTGGRPSVTAGHPSGGSVTSTVARPSGLPLGQGFQLRPVSGLPPELASTISDSAITEIPLERLRMATRPAAGPVSHGAQALGAGWAGGVANSSYQLRTYGFLPAGLESVPQTSVGLVAVPRFGPLNWGHTAVYVRQNGRIVMVRGFNPDMQTPGGLFDLAVNRAGVKAGDLGVPARITDDVSLFETSLNRARSVEWPASSAEAQNLLGRLPEPGLAADVGAPPVYSARPAVYGTTPRAQVCTGSNCGLWAIDQIEAQGGVVGRPGQGPITAVGEAGTVANTAHQPEIIRMLNEGDVAPLTAGGDAAVVSGMSRSLRFLRVGGRVMLVVGVVAGGVEIYTAPPEQRTRTAIGVGAGFAGGFALGATAGLFCGPGAPVCSVVAGLALGTAGAFGARAAAEGIYDATTAQGSAITDPAEQRRTLQQANQAAPCPNCHQGPARSTTSSPTTPSAFDVEAGRPLSSQDQQVLLRYLQSLPAAAH